MSFRIAVSVGILLAWTTTSQGRSALTRYSYSEPHMGTTFKVLIYAPDEATANSAARAAFARIAELDGIMSDYKATSELMRLCNRAGGDPVKISDDLYFVLSRAQEMARRSDGAFDVTIGPVVRLWRRARKSFQLPDSDELATARKLVGPDKLKLDSKAQTARLTTPGMKLDLGGIAKGHAADEAIKVIVKHGIKAALVAAGGDIVAQGAPPETKGWKVGIAPLTDPEGKPKRYLYLKDAAVSTSGDAEQYVEIDEKRYSHIVDPRTGVGILGQFSVTVVAKDGTTSDALATAVAVLGEDRGLKLVDDTPETAALFIRKIGKTETTTASKRFKELNVQEEK